MQILLLLTLLAVSAYAQITVIQYFSDNVCSSTAVTSEFASNSGPCIPGACFSLTGTSQATKKKHVRWFCTPPREV
jgi:hypothetical protein